MIDHLGQGRGRAALRPATGFLVRSPSPTLSSGERSPHRSLRHRSHPPRRACAGGGFRHGCHCGEASARPSHDVWQIKGTTLSSRATSQPLRWPAVIERAPAMGALYLSRRLAESGARRRCGRGRCHRGLVQQPGLRLRARTWAGVRAVTRRATLIIPIREERSTLRKLRALGFTFC